MVGASQIDQSHGPNINGPALIRAPSWLRESPGRYLLYFSQHRGGGIWLATSDAITGPWHIYPRPVLTLADTHYTDHLASPDVIVDDARHEIRMYFHGGSGTALSEQSQSLAVSDDGVKFRLQCRDIGVPYWRVFRHANRWFALVMPGTILGSDDGLSGFEPVAEILPPNTRHAAVSVMADRALVFWSAIGGRPECILAGWIDLATDPSRWRVNGLGVLLAPEEPYEGGSLPLLASAPGQCDEPARELRDPGTYVEEDILYLAYTAGGERCIALATMHLPVSYSTTTTVGLQPIRVSPT